MMSVLFEISSAILLPMLYVVCFIYICHFVGDSFSKRVDEYLCRCLRKGVPSLFTSLKPLYTDQSKVNTIQQLVITYYQTLKDKQMFHPDGECCNVC